MCVQGAIPFPGYRGQVRCVSRAPYPVLGVEEGEMCVQGAIPCTGCRGQVRCVSRAPYPVLGIGDR
jgi:hypothetical protein